MSQQVKEESTKVGISDFCTKIVLGKGSFGKVILVKKIDTGRFYAMKVIKKARLEQQTQVNKVIVERSIMVGVQHPFVIKLFYSFQTDDKLYFILEYCPGGDLFHLLRKLGKFSEDLARFYSAQIVLAIEHLHSNNIIYRDLKPENAMIDFEGYLRLTDFGLSKQKQSGDKAYSICGTPEYLAPEILNMQGHDNSVDWWSLGSFLFELLTGLPPFYNQNRELIYEAIRTQEVVMPDYFSEISVDLVSKLLQKNPDKRLGHRGAAEIKAHPFFANVNWQILYRKEYRPPFVPVIDHDFGLCYFSDEYKNLPIDSLSSSVKASQATNRIIEGFSFNQSQQQRGIDTN